MSYDPSNRREIVYGNTRARWLTILASIALGQALVLLLWGSFLLVKFSGSETEGAVHLRHYLTLFILPVAAAQVVVGAMLWRFLRRRNATARLLASLMAMLLVFEGSALRGVLGVVLTVLALALLALALIPDKDAPEPGAPTPGTGS